MKKLFFNVILSIVIFTISIFTVNADFNEKDNKFVNRYFIEVNDEELTPEIAITMMCVNTLPEYNLNMDLDYQYRVISDNKYEVYYSDGTPWFELEMSYKNI